MPGWRYKYDVYYRVKNIFPPVVFYFTINKLMPSFVSAFLFSTTFEVIMLLFSVPLCCKPSGEPFVSVGPTWLNWHEVWLNRSIHMLRVPRERTLAPSHSLYPATTWSSVQRLSRTVRIFFLLQQNERRSFFPSLKFARLCRPMLDGRLGAGAQLLQSLQADSQSWERSRYQHVFRVFPYSPTAAVQCSQWYRAFTVSI